MKAIIAMVLSFVMLCAARAQESQSMQTKHLRLDLAVPESPAFRIIDDEPAVILRPSDVREIALEAANILVSKGLLPDKYAVEFAPFMLIAGDALDATTYNKIPFLYRTRISVASKRESDDAPGTLASIGFRFTIINDGDPRTDNVYRKDLSAIAMKITKAMSAANTTAPTEGVSTPTADVSDLVAEIVEKRAEQRENAWNKPILDLGIAFRGRSADDQLSALMGTGMGLWSAGGFAPFENSHLIFGFNAMVDRPDSGALDHKLGGAAVRLYYGSSAMKMSVEGEGKWSDGVKPIYKFALAAEAALSTGFWVDAGLAYEGGEGAPNRFVPKLNIRWAVDETDAAEVVELIN